VRLLWLQGSRELWVEVREADERALDAFHHPYAHAGSHRLLLPAESLAVYDRGPQQSARNNREQ
jgi:hypothetical protein